MTNMLLRTARQLRGWNQQQLADFAGVSRSTIERAERGEPIRADNMQRICTCLEKTPEQLGLIKDFEDVNRREASKVIGGFVSGLFLTSSTEQIDLSSLTKLWADDLLSIYARGIAACQNLYYNGNPHQVEAILPLYSHQTALLAQQPGTLQRSAAKLASQAYQLACELATDREDFGTARQTGRQAFCYAQLAKDTNLQVNALISLANLSWHLSSAQPALIRTHSKNALQAYKEAVSLLNKNVTPLLKGRTYAGIAEVYAMRGQYQESMRAMGLAYEHFPMEPEKDPAYPYLRASRYSLYVFGDAQSRLLLHQPKEADKALVAMQKETNDPEIEPITKVDLLYYQAEAQIQLGELEPASMILTEAAQLAKELGSRLYFNKLAASYRQLKEQWPKEPIVAALEEVFQTW
jgi:transcriptional regulator with XRE-family HTH domain